MCDSNKKPVVSGIWNQDLKIIPEQRSGLPPVKKIKTLNPSMGLSSPPENPAPARAPIQAPSLPLIAPVSVKGPEDKKFDLNLSEESSDDDGTGGEKVKKTRPADRMTDLCKLSLMDHDYCYTAWYAAQPSEDLGDMEKLLSTVAMGSDNNQLVSPPLNMPLKVRSLRKPIISNMKSESFCDFFQPDECLLLPQVPIAPSKLPKKHKKKKESKKKKKKKKKKKQKQEDGSSSSRYTKN